MKTIKSIDAEIQMELDKLQITTTEFKRGKISDSVYNKSVNNASSVLNFLRMCKYYLETNPREEFVKSEIDRINNRIKKIDTGFEYYLAHEKIKDPVLAKNVYYAETDYKKITKQLRTLVYIYQD